MRCTFTALFPDSGAFMAVVERSVRTVIARGSDNKGSSPPRSEGSSFSALIGSKSNIYIAI